MHNCVEEIGAFSLKMHRAFKDLGFFLCLIMTGNYFAFGVYLPNHFVLVKKKIKP
jgi:hypothetical protein